LKAKRKAQGKTEAGGKKSRESSISNDSKVWSGQDNRPGISTKRQRFRIRDFAVG